MLILADWGPAATSFLAFLLLPLESTSGRLLQVDQGSDELRDELTDQGGAETLLMSTATKRKNPLRGPTTFLNVRLRLLGRLKCLKPDIAFKL